MANITQEDMARRVASRYIRAQDEAPQAPEAQQAQQAPTALPQSGVGRNIVKGALDKVVAAFEEGDEELFHKELDGLLKAAKHGA